jgi:hypothetical protein
MTASDYSVPSISEFVQMRAWKHALFTTYSLSLSYFESEVLLPLLRGGCSDIWLIADAEGYRSSLLERRSMRVGQEYRLIPAALPDGVFHAKCIYLAGDEDDLLLVGSGNVDLRRARQERGRFLPHLLLRLFAISRISWSLSARAPTSGSPGRNGSMILPPAPGLRPTEVATKTVCRRCVSYTL